VILLDSYGWLEYFADGPRAEKYASYVEQVRDDTTVLPTIVLYEVYKKIKREWGEERALEAYAQLMRARVIPLDASLALEAADVSLELGLSMADAIVYATAKRAAATLVTSDEHFRGVEDVEFIGADQ
jgi:predicted nucleic acid-binding protein